MIFNIPDLWIGFIIGMITMFLIIILLGWLLQPRKEVIDKYHPLNKAE